MSLYIKVFLPEALGESVTLLLKLKDEFQSVAFLRIYPLPVWRAAVVLHMSLFLYRPVDVLDAFTKEAKFY